MAEERSLIVDCDAEEELAAAVSWYTSEVSKRRGVRKIAVEGFRVVYQELPALLYIIAIAHFRRRPGYWRFR